MCKEVKRVPYEPFEYDPYSATVEDEPVGGFAASEPLTKSVSGPKKASLWARLKLLFRPRYS